MYYHWKVPRLGRSSSAEFRKPCDWRLEISHGPGQCVTFFVPPNVGLVADLQPLRSQSRFHSPSQKKVTSRIAMKSLFSFLDVMMNEVGDVHHVCRWQTAELCTCPCWRLEMGQVFASVTTFWGACEPVHIASQSVKPLELSVFFQCSIDVAADPLCHFGHLI